MRGRQLLGSQRPRCAVSTLNYFPNEVCSFPFFWSLVYSFRGRNVPKEGGFSNTPSRESLQYMILKGCIRVPSVTL